MDYQENDNEKAIHKTTTMQVDEPGFIPKRPLLQTVHASGIGPVKTLIDSSRVWCAISLNLLTVSMIAKITCLQMENSSLAKRADPSTKPLFLGFVHLDVSYI